MLHENQLRRHLARFSLPGDRSGHLHGGGKGMWNAALHVPGSSQIIRKSPGFVTGLFDRNVYFSVTALSIGYMFFIGGISEKLRGSPHFSKKFFR